MTFDTPGMACSKRPKSITGRQDKHRSRLDPTFPLLCRGLQPTGLICHVEVFQVAMAVEENPALVTDFPELSPANPSRASHIRPLDIHESESDDHR